MLKRKSRVALASDSERSDASSDDDNNKTTTSGGNSNNNNSSNNSNNNNSSSSNNHHHGAGGGGNSNNSSNNNNNNTSSTASTGASSAKKRIRLNQDQDDEDATSDSGDEWGSKGGTGRKKVLTKKTTSPRSGTAGGSRSAGSGASEGAEEGELSGDSSVAENSNESGGDSDESEEFNDGYDENLMGDEEDQAWLRQMTEKQREQEIFNRIEKRETLKARFEIEKKLRQAKRKRESKAKEEQRQDRESKGKDKSFTDVSMRSKERKKNLEGRQDKKSQAIQNLRAEREKKKKAEEERKEKEDTEKEPAPSRRDKDKSADKADRTDKADKADKADKVERDSGALKKLKASDVYSDDDDTDSDGSDSSSRSRAASSKQSRRSRSRSKSRSHSSRSRSRDSRSKSASRSRSRSSSSSRSRSRSRSRSSDSDSGASAASRHSEEKVVFSKDHVSQIRLSRFRLEKWLFAPFFTKTVVGCFVRIGIGQKSGESVYRVAEILDVVETPKVYQLGKNRTNKGLRLKHGKDERVFRIEYVSNQDFTDAEFAKWMEVMAVDSLSLPTISFVERKKRDVDAANNHSYSVSDINLIVSEKKKFKRNPHNYAMAKTEVMKKKEMAEQLGDLEEARKWGEELERLEDRAKELDKQRTSTISAIQYINERNRHKNIVDIEKAILEDAKKNKMRADDPFTRRKCAPSLVTKKSGGTDKLTSEQLRTLEEARRLDAERRKAAEEAKLKADEENARKEKERARSQLATANGGDLFAAHNFDIAINLDVSISAPHVAHNTVRASLGVGGGAGSTGATGTSVLLKDSAPRRSLNIEEYKKKRGFI